MSDVNVYPLGGGISQKSFNGSTLITSLTAGFWAAKVFRAYKEVLTDITLRVTASVPFMLTSQVLAADNGT